MASGLKAKAALSERGDDLYETPAVAVTALLRPETLPPVVWEPACGPGAIVGPRHFSLPRSLKVPRRDIPGPIPLHPSIYPASFRLPAPE